MSAPHVSVVGLSTVPASPTASHSPIHPPTPTPPFVPVVSTLYITFTNSGTTSVSTASITVGYTSVSVFPPSQTHLPSQSPSVTSHSAAIAGGVLGGLAILIAALAAILCLRRRSPRFRRNRHHGAKWSSLNDIKLNHQISPPLSTPRIPSLAESPLVSQDKKILYDDPSSSPSHPLVDSMPPFRIHDDRRQPISDPFADPPVPPASHRRDDSSFALSSNHRMHNAGHIESSANTSPFNA